MLSDIVLEILADLVRYEIKENILSGWIEDIYKNNLFAYSTHTSELHGRNSTFNSNQNT